MLARRLPRPAPPLTTTESVVTANPALHPYPIAPRVTSLIDGVSVSAQAPGHDIAIIDPTTEQPLSTLREADASEVDCAVHGAEL